MSEIPLNEKLWTMVVFQAKTKYHPYPSPGASAWAHKHYIELGGKFGQANEQTKRANELKARAVAAIKEKKANESKDSKAKKSEDGKKKHGDK